MTSFNPGDVVRYGKDNALYVRAINGSWYYVSIGYPENEGAPSGHTVYKNDERISMSISEGYASVIYQSPGHYWSEIY